MAILTQNVAEWSSSNLCSRTISICALVSFEVTSSRVLPNYTLTCFQIVIDGVLQICALKCFQIVIHIMILICALRSFQTMIKGVLPICDLVYFQNLLPNFASQSASDVCSNGSVKLFPRTSLFLACPALFYHFSRPCPALR